MSGSMNREEERFSVALRRLWMLNKLSKGLWSTPTRKRESSGLMASNFFFFLKLIKF